jgi:hypothetical protein
MHPAIPIKSSRTGGKQGENRGAIAPFFYLIGLFFSLISGNLPEVSLSAFERTGTIAYPQE